MIGMMFPERNDSFDFIQALDEFKKVYRLDKGLDKEYKPEANRIQEDLSLKEGEKIHVSIPGVTTGTREPKKSGGGGLKKLAPPPGFKGKPKTGGGATGSVETKNLLDPDPPAEKPNDGIADLLGGGMAIQNQQKKEDAFDELFSNLNSNQAQ